MQATNQFAEDAAPFLWQQSQWDIFTSQLKQQKLSQAYLLCGAKNLGKHEFAKAMANYILCSKSSPQLCNNCKNCLLIAAETHPDLVYIKPETLTAEIKIEQIRKLNTFIYQTSKLGGNKVVIIAPADKLNRFSANALLKSLEEPGKDTIFILVTASQSSLLPTIRSRCQKIVFNNPTTAMALNYLAATITDPKQAIELLTISQGSPLQALKIYTNKENYYQEFTQNISAMLAGKKSIVATAKIWYTKEITVVITWLIDWLNDSIIFAITHNQQLLNNANSYKIAKFFASKNPIIKLFSIRDYLIEQKHLLAINPNINKLLLIEAIFCRYVELVV